MISGMKDMPDLQTSLPGGHSEVEPPDPIPNSEVKRFSADGSVGPPHVRVGHCQALTPKALYHSIQGFFYDCGFIYRSASFVMPHSWFFCLSNMKDQSP